MIRRCFLFAAFPLLALIPCHAQSNYAVVRGSVVDPQHRPLPSAHVHLTSADTSAQREVVANTTGLYEIAGVQPGSYELSVESSGFQPSKQRLTLEVGQQATVDVVMRVGGDQQSVTVEAAGAKLLKHPDASL